jgi:hypothetical protein
MYVCFFELFLLREMQIIGELALSDNSLFFCPLVSLFIICLEEPCHCIHHSLCTIQQNRNSVDTFTDIYDGRGVSFGIFP